MKYLLSLLILVGGCISPSSPTQHDASIPDVAQDAQQSIIVPEASYQAVFPQDMHSISAGGCPTEFG